jgi:hypothetical protein
MLSVIAAMSRSLTYRCTSGASAGVNGRRIRRAVVRLGCGAGNEASIYD